MNTIKWLCLFFVLLKITPSNAQTPFFERIYGQSYATDVDVKSNGNLIIASTIINAGFTGYAIEVNALGDTLHTFRYPNSFMHSIRYTSDGGFLFMADTLLFGSDHESRLCKTDSNGIIQWRVPFPTTEFFTYSASLLIHPSGLYYAGYVDDMSMMDNYYFIKAVQPNGQLLNSRVVNGSASLWQYNQGLQLANDSEMIAVSSVSSTGCTEFIVLCKMDHLGQAQWYRTYSGPNMYFGNGIVQNADGGYLIAGTEEAQNNCSSVIFRKGLLLKTAANGDSLWSRTYAFPNTYVQFRDIVKDSFGHFYIAGDYRNANTQAVLLMKTDSLGDTLWTRRFYGQWGATPYKMILDAAGNPTLVGSSKPSAFGVEQIYLLKTDTAGNCSPLSVASTQTPSINMSIYPNPATEQVTLQTSAGIKREGQITILTTQGQILHQQQIQTDTPVALPKLAAGLYVVELLQDGSLVTQKLIIR
ncbi:MAG: T9SS type A sorting domain-containing protein [Bacteroidia bacterium]